uniref:AlNc14C375G11161 protein n=1 Tax=Albugo laibachii Nc14 TaxID=890382 RepID=F0WYA1_9STRA|nr:AlNc14C375G11161 [Albugo laibachii Nc14]|eukprot:CCA26453.1 AlNc14C375G11161 [Albugo laibachii Nc14]
MPTKVNVVEAYSLCAWIHSFILKFIATNGIAHNHEKKSNTAIPFSSVPIASIARNLLATAFPEFDKNAMQNDWEAVWSILTAFYERPSFFDFRSLPQRLKWPIQLKTLPEHGISQIIDYDTNLIKALELLLVALVQSRMREGYIRDITSLEYKLQANLMTIIDRNLHHANTRAAGSDLMLDKDANRLENCAENQSQCYDEITNIAPETEFSQKEVLARLKLENQLLKEESVHLGVSIEKSREDEKTLRLAHDKLREALDEMKSDTDIQLMKKERQLRSLYEDQITSLRSELTEVQLKSREQCTLMQQISELQDEVDLLRPAAERTGKAEIAIIKYKAKIEELTLGKEKLHLLESSNESFRNRIIELETEMEKAKTLQRRLLEAKNSTTTANVRVSELEAQSNVKSAAIEHLRTENESLQKSLKEAQSMLDQSTTMTSDQVNVYEKESAAVDMLMSEYNPEMLEKIARLEHENQELQNRVKNESSENLEKLLDQLDDSDRLKTSFETKYHQAKDDLAATFAAKSILEEQLTEWRSTCAMQNEEMLQQRYRWEKLIAELRISQNENAIRRGEIANYEVKTEELLKKLESTIQAYQSISNELEECKRSSFRMQQNYSNWTEMQLEELAEVKFAYRNVSWRYEVLHASNESLEKCAYDQKLCIHRLEIDNRKLMDEARERSIKLETKSQSLDRSDMRVNDLENRVCTQQILTKCYSDRMDEMTIAIKSQQETYFMSMEDSRSILVWRQQQHQTQLELLDRKVWKQTERNRCLRESMRLCEEKLLAQVESMDRAISIKVTTMQETCMKQGWTRIRAFEERIIAFMKKQLSSLTTLKDKMNELCLRIQKLQQEKDDANEKLRNQLLLNDQARDKHEKLESLYHTMGECFQMAREEAENLAYDVNSFRNDARMRQLAIENGRKQYTKLEVKLDGMKASTESIVKEKGELSHKLKRLQNRFRESEHTVTTLESKLIRLERERSHFTGQRRHLDDEKVSITANLSTQVKLLSMELKRVQAQALQSSEIGGHLVASPNLADCKSSTQRNCIEKEANGASLDYSQLLERLETFRQTEGAKRREILLFNATLLQTQHQLMEKNKVLCQEIQHVNEQLNRALLENERTQQRCENGTLQRGSDTNGSTLGKRKLMEEVEKETQLEEKQGLVCSKKKRTLFAQNKEWIDSVSTLTDKPSECTQQ